LRIHLTTKQRPLANTTMLNQSTIAALTSNSTLADLLSAATPVLRIDGLKNETWRRRKGKDPHDFRLGPWRAADWSILDEAMYRADGEVLYLLSDGAGRIRYVGESKGRLRTRWRTPPLAEPVDGKDNAHIFHNIAWPKIEETLDSNPAAGPFCVSVIGIERMTALVNRHADLRTAVELDSCRHDGRKHLSWHVETWLCEQPGLHAHLWNVAKRGHVARRA
jgi:hypothetical protein